ncbi:hypothetical protein OSTOST_10183 [Ostertagia ostertagi]
MPILKSSVPREGTASPISEAYSHGGPQRSTVSLEEAASTTRPGTVASPVAGPIASTFWIASTCGSPRLVETSSRPAAAVRADTHAPSYRSTEHWVCRCMLQELPSPACPGIPRKSAEMMNGTSMSSPNTTGAIACMLSKLRSENIQWTPYRVRLALENTAAGNANEEAFGGGYGLVQVLNGYEYMRSYKDVLPPLFMTDIDVRVKQSNRSMRGIYIRELLESQNLQEYTVSIQPKFKEFSDNIGKSDLAMKISLQSEGEFLEFPRTFLLTAGEGHFAVKVDPTVLSRGEFAYTEIVGLCEDNYAFGPLFRVPITVISPEGSFKRK